MANKETRDFSKMEAIDWIVINNPQKVHKVYNNANGEFSLGLSVPYTVQNLKLPNGWTYKHNTGITNKHNSSTGLYEIILLYRIS